MLQEVEDYKQRAQCLKDMNSELQDELNETVIRFIYVYYLIYTYFFIRTLIKSFFCSLFFFFPVEITTQYVFLLYVKRYIERRV